VRRVGDFPFPSRSPVTGLRCGFVLTEWKSTELLRLPGELLWALALLEGTRLAGVLEPKSKIRFSKETGGSCHAVMAAKGCLNLEPLGTCVPITPWEPAYLQAEIWPGEASFTLEPSPESPCEFLFAQAIYRLEVGQEHRVALPEDALWALRLHEGKSAACRVVMWTLEGGTASEKKGPYRQRIGRGGALPLPGPLQAEARLQPGSPVRFEVNLQGQDSWFRLEPDLSRE